MLGALGQGVGLGLCMGRIKVDRAILDGDMSDEESKFDLA